MVWKGAVDMVTAKNQNFLNVELYLNVEFLLVIAFLTSNNYF